MSSDVSGLLEQFQRKYSTGGRTNRSAEANVLLESERILQEFGVRPKTQRPKEGKSRKLAPTGSGGVFTDYVAGPGRQTKEKVDDGELVRGRVSERRDRTKARQDGDEKRDPVRRKQRNPLEPCYAPNEACSKWDEANKQREKVGLSAKTDSTKIVPGKMGITKTASNKTAATRTVSGKADANVPEKIQRKKTVDELTVMFSRVALRVIRPIWKMWKVKAEDIRDCELQVSIIHNQILKRRAFRRFVETCEQKRLQPRFDEMEKLWRLDELGTAFAKHHLRSKFMGLWVRRFNVKKEEELQNPPPVEKKPVKRKRKPIPVLRFEKYEFVRKPAPPPIEIDPAGQEMLERAEGIHKKRIDKVKRRMEVEKAVEMEKMAKEKQKAEIKRKMHREELMKAKHDRLVKQNRITEVQEMCALAEEAAKRWISKNAFRDWRKAIAYCNRRLENCARRVHLMYIRRCFRAMKRETRENQGDREILAISFEQKRLFAKVRVGIQRVALQRAENEKRAIMLHEKQAKCHCLCEWKEARIIRKRQRMGRAVGFYHTILKRRALQAVVLGISNIKASQQHHDFKNRLLQKANMFFQDMSDSATLTASASITVPPLRSSTRRSTADATVDLSPDIGTLPDFASIDSEEEDEDIF